MDKQFCMNCSECNIGRKHYSCVRCERFSLWVEPTFSCRYFTSPIIAELIRDLKDKESELYDKLLHEDLTSTGISPHTETRKGHWEDCSNGWMCSVCGKDSTYDYEY